MLKHIFTPALLFLVSAIPATALELVMVEQQGCFYCQKWDEDVAPKYSKTKMGELAPLRRVDKSEAANEIELSGVIIYTPTFVFVEDKKEVKRLEGYASEDFFWALGEEFVENYFADDKTQQLDE